MMKNLLITGLFLMGMCFGFSAVAQTKNDVLVLLSGERKEVKVTGVDDTHIKFRYPGEEFDNEISKTELAQVEFGSGRVEKFGSNSGGPAMAPAPKTNHGSSPDRHNKIAILPFDFVSNDPGLSPESMSKLVQSATSNYVRSEYGTLILQDPTTTNALLARHSINYSNMASYTPDELGEILGVEFVIFGTVNITNKGTSTFGSSSGIYKEKDSSNGNKGQTKGSVFSVSSSSTTIECDTSVDFRLFNDRGENLYSGSRHVFGTTTDAYEGGISYMVKRTPFGSKYGKK